MSLLLTQHIALLLSASCSPHQGLCTTNNSLSHWWYSKLCMLLGCPLWQLHLDYLVNQSIPIHLYLRAVMAWI
eukprot:jgi/Chrzof1/12391/Cz06g32220.t1